MLAQPLRMDFGQPWSWRWIGGTLVLYAGLLIWFFDERKGFEVATLVRASNSAALVALTASAIRLAGHERSRNAWFMVWGYSLFTVTMMINAVMTWWREDSLYALQLSVFNHVMGFASLMTILLTYMGYLGLVLERTQRINAQLRRAQWQAQQWRVRAQALTLLDRQRTLAVLANSLGHDILQHLTSTQLNLQHALRVHRSLSADPAQIDQALQRTQGGLERSARLLDRIRNFLKPLPSREEVLDLRTIVHNAYDLLRQEMMYRRIDFKVEVPSAPVWVKAESLLLIQALVQLLRNAMQALDGQSKCRMQVILSSSAGWAKIEVRDSGPGFAADLLDQKNSFHAPAADVQQARHFFSPCLSFYSKIIQFPNSADFQILMKASA